MLTLICSMEVMALELSYPAEIVFDPSCSDWSYAECSIEVSGHLYYRFNIGFTEGDFEDVSMLLDYDNCTDWTWIENRWGQECYTFGYITAGKLDSK